MSYLLPPMPEVIREAIHRWLSNLPPPMPERVGDVIRRRRARREMILAYLRMRELRCREARDARSPKRAEPRREPAPRREFQPIEVDPVPHNAFPVSSLAEEEIAVLALPTRDVRGFFRWEKSRGNRRKRVYYELVSGGTRRIDYQDNPKHFYPAHPIKVERTEPARPAPAEPEKFEPELEERIEDITDAAVRARMINALRTLERLPDLEARFLTAGNRINWPATVDSDEDLEAQKENQDNADSAARPAKKRPSAADFSAMNEPLDWFAELNLPPRERLALIRAGERPFSEEQWLVWWRARDLTYRTVAKNLGVSHDTARRNTEAVFSRLAAIAKRRVEAGRTDAAAIAA